MASDSKQCMPTVDLRLAVNYIPALECIVKSLCMTASITLLQQNQHLSLYLILSILLHLDRIVSKPLIFDGNSILCCLLASWVINHMRTMQQSPVYLTETLTFVWICFSFCLVIEPKCMQEQLYTSGIRQLTPSLTTSLLAALISFTTTTPDTTTVHVLRSLTFTALCVSWVYIVGVWRPRPRCQIPGLCVYGTQTVLARFIPVLFIYPVLVLVYAVCSLAIFLYHYMQMHHTPQAEPIPTPNLAIETIQEDEDEDLEAFRSACQSRQSSV